MEPEVLCEHILYQNGPFMEIRRWLRGRHPERGQLVQGITGWETLEEKRVIRPFHKFVVEEKPVLPEGEDGRREAASVRSGM